MFYWLLYQINEATKTPEKTCMNQLAVPAVNCWMKSQKSPLFPGASGRGGGRGYKWLVHYWEHLG